MYYHQRPLKYITYGKVTPPPAEDYDEWDASMYKWLGVHCGFYPQIWLSRSHSSITGYKANRRLKKSYYWAQESGTRNTIKTNNDSVLFCFDVIKGFHVSYEHWTLLMNVLMNVEGFEEQNKEIIERLNSYIDDEYERGDSIELDDWADSGRNLDIFLKKYVFVEKDQIVVPSLNLKSAKKIICRNEKQKRKLRKMGFIEDRIQIKNIKPWRW
jgi:hypothetical protein